MEPKVLRSNARLSGESGFDQRSLVFGSVKSEERVCKCACARTHEKSKGSATGALALRQALLRGQDLLLMPAGWWPNFQCPRRHGWWVRALSEVQVQLCSKCRNITALPDFRCTGSPCLRCEQGIRPSPGAHRDRASFFRPAGTKRDRPIVSATSTTQSRKVKRQRRGSTLHRHPVTSPAESASDPETDHHDTIQAADSEDD